LRSGEGLKQYIAAVKEGTIPACLHLRNAISRYERDLADSRFIYDEERVNTVVDFIAHLKHFEGRHSGKVFRLEPWQLFIVANIYGFYWADTGLRRFQDVYIEVARKNGKTAFAAALALYHLIADGEGAAQVLIAANSKEQAHICYSLTDKFCKGLDPNEAYLRRYRSDILFDRTDSMLKVLAADSDKLDGYNCSFGVLDEYHAAPNSKVRDVIKSSMAMRTNPLLLTITTAGFDKTLPCYDLRTVCTEVAAGIKEDNSLFSLIFTMDEEDKWDNPELWIKSNPSLGVTVNEPFIRQQVIKAKNNPSDEVGIKTKNLNIWCDSAQTWIPDDYIIRATKKLSFDMFPMRDCYIGVDLASVQDFTAVAYIMEHEHRRNIIVKYYLPAESVKTSPDKELYNGWARQGYLTLTPGNVTDYDYITRDILSISNGVSVDLIYYDKYNATSWAIDATEIGLPLEPYSQTIGNFNAPTRELERAIMRNEVVLDDNPITRYCFRNVELKSDHNGNVKPNKGVQGKKIDGVIAIIQAYAAFVKRNENVYTGSVY
jgi:phage terminase large subunit-like protein